MDCHERYGIRFDFITRIGRNQKSQTQYGISWNPEYNVLYDCTNPYMSLSIGTSWRTENSHISICFDENWKTKINMKINRKKEIEIRIEIIKNKKKEKERNGNKVPF